MSALRAYFLPHPPLAVPQVGRGDEKMIQKTLDAFDRTAKEIAALKPETIVFITPHSILYADYFHISPGKGAKGSFARFGAPGVGFDVGYDREMADKIIEIAESKELPVGYMGEKDPALDHGVTVPLWFINRYFNDFNILRISQSGESPSSHYLLGQAIQTAAEKIGRRTVLIASGDLSHKLPGSHYGYAPEGVEYDKRITEVMASADFLSAFNIPGSLRERPGECGHNSLMVLAGIFDSTEVTSELYSYEGPFGVGYGIACFSPGKADESRNFLEQYEKQSLQQALEIKKGEDAYQSLARQSLEYTVKTSQRLDLPEDLPKELLNMRAGVFVSLHKNGALRGCIGTISPAAENIAREIIRNAVSAGLEDGRFLPVTEDELPFLTYKVDVLMPTEPISGPEELDVKKYGVIVTSGYKRGLLLPNLDGIDTVDEQIAIAKRKAGIREGETVSLERFEVIRHE